MAKMPVAKTAVVKRTAGKKAVAKTAATKMPVAEKSAAKTAAIDPAGREEIWAQAERDYGDPGIKVSEIAKRVGLATVQFNRKVKSLGWHPRPKSSDGPLNGAATKTRTPNELVRRVYNTIDGELTKLEKQTGASSQDRERASRALSQMVNSLEKAIDMQREITKDTTKGSGKKHKEELAHAEDLRRAIAERIERLQRKRTPDAGSADADSK